MGSYAGYDQCKAYIDAMAYTDSVDEYNEHWSALQSQFQFAVPYLETWHRKRHLWSYAWTHLHFNNGSTANSVAESSNAAFLGWMWRCVDIHLCSIND